VQVVKAGIRYFWYVLRHKWFVFVECCRLGIPWLGLIHDLSKLHPVEFRGYVLKYELPKITGQKPDRRTEEAYLRAWHHHQKHNPHHWIYWAVFVPVSGQVREAFAGQAHESWSRWMDHLFSMSHPYEGGSVLIPPDLVQRWMRQAGKAYDDLADGERQSDLAVADGYLAILDERTTCLPMPERYAKEMLSDWRGAQRALTGKDETAAWYTSQRDRMLLHPNTREWIEAQLGLTFIE
jgi:hypothetical protein